MNLKPHNEFTGANITARCRE